MNTSDNEFCQHGTREECEICSFTNPPQAYELDIMKGSFNERTYVNIENKILENEPSAYITFKYRWIILVLFLLCCASSTLQWPEYAIISNTIVRYYEVPYIYANMTGIVFLLGFIISIYPATYIIEKWGIRVAVLLACLGSAAGAWIKVASIKSDRFWVLLLGQSVVALTQGLVTPLPATVAATWFGHQQVSTACSIGALGIQLGIAFGSFISPMIVDGTRDTEVIEEGLYTLALGVAILCSGIAVIAFIGFKKKPRTLPSHAQFALKQTSMSVKESILTLIKDFPFLMIVMGFSCNVGIFYALGTVLNQLVLTNHANGAIHVGRLGVLFVMTGMIGSAIFGYMLDKYHKFKTTTLVSFTVGFVALVAFSLCLNQEIEIMYVLTAVIGFFSAPSIPIGFQVVTEITYPVPPSISSGALLIASKVFGIVLTQMYSFILSNHNGILTNLLFPMVILIGILLVAFVRFELRRQTAEIGVVMPR